MSLNQSSHEVNCQKVFLVTNASLLPNEEVEGKDR